MVNGDKESATIGKNFIVKLLSKMNTLGYDFVTASDLTRTIDMVSHRLSYTLGVNFDMRLLPYFLQ